MSTKADDLRVNKDIKANQIRLIDPEGEQIGIVELKRGLREADDRDLDLVEVAPDASPPVCRIMDYGKYRYEREKQAKRARKRQKTMELKEIQFTPQIQEHDYEFKKNDMQRFLENYNKAKATIRFRGRQMKHTDQGRELLDRLIDDLSEYGEVEEGPELDGKVMYVILVPKSK